MKRLTFTEFIEKEAMNLYKLINNEHNGYDYNSFYQYLRYLQLLGYNTSIFNSFDYNYDDTNESIAKYIENIINNNLNNNTVMEEKKIILNNAILKDIDDIYIINKNINLLDIDIFYREKAIVTILYSSIEELNTDWNTLKEKI